MTRFYSVDCVQFDLVRIVYITFHIHCDDVHVCMHVRVIPAQPNVHSTSTHSSFVYSVDIVK